MTSVALFKQDGSQNGTVELNDSVFSVEANESAEFDAILRQRASLRQGTHAVKNRSAVRGGGKKPWRQKGTGRARQGSSAHLNSVAVGSSSARPLVPTTTHYHVRFVN